MASFVRTGTTVPLSIVEMRSLSRRSSRFCEWVAGTIKTPTIPNTASLRNVVFNITRLHRNKEDSKLCRQYSTAKVGFLSTFPLMGRSERMYESREKHVGHGKEGRVLKRRTTGEKRGMQEANRKKEIASPGCSSGCMSSR